MIELMSLYTFLPSCAPLVAFGVGDGRWAMWTKQRTTVALRQVVSLAELRPDEYALHSLRIGGATYLAAKGASSETLRQEGRWAGDSSFDPYLRNVGGNADWVSSTLEQAGGELQPGQQTKWGQVE